MSMANLQRTVRWVPVVLVGAALALAVQAQGPEPVFESSPAGRRAHRDYTRQTDAARTEYERSLERASASFVSRSSNAVRTYLRALERAQRDHTRAGDLDVAREVQAMAQTAGTWSPSAPGPDGRCFIDDIDLDVAGSEPASSAGVELLVTVTEQKQAYQVASVEAGEVYRQAVLALRGRYRVQLERALEHATRGGDLNAADEVQAALDTLDAMGEDVALPGGLAGGEHVSLVPADGFYYSEMRRTRGSKIGERFDLLYAVRDGEASLVGNRWRSGDWEFSPHETSGEADPLAQVYRVCYLYGRNRAEGPLVDQWTFDEGQPTEARLWWDQASLDDHPDSPNAVGSIERIGSTLGDDQMQGFDEGDEFLLHFNVPRIKADASADNTPFIWRLGVSLNQVFFHQYKWGNENWSGRLYILCDIEVDDDVWTVTFDHRLTGNHSVIEIDFGATGLPELKMWWQRLWYDNGDEPSATGRLRLE